jgi:hypothetical protein
MELKRYKRLFIIVGAVTGALAIAGTAALITTSRSSGASAAATPSSGPPPVTGLSAAFAVPSAHVTVTPASPSDVAAQANSPIRNVCSSDGHGCINSTPDSIQYVLWSDSSNPTDAIVDYPVFLFTWTLQGNACLLGLGGAAGGPTPNVQGSCTVGVAIDPKTGTSFDTYETAASRIVAVPTS